MTTPLTKEEFKEYLPKQVKGNLTQEVIDDINKIISDPLIGEHFRENIVSYTSVAQEGKFKVTDYVSACKYVTHKLLGSSNKQAYMKTFPDRWNLLQDSGKTEKEISAYVAAYNKNKLVNLIWEQTLVPVHVLNADIHQKSINTLAQIMVTSESDKCRVDAASALLTNLKPPETKKMELGVTMKDNTIEDLKTAITQLATMQKDSINSGLVTAKDVANTSIVINHDDL